MVNLYLYDADKWYDELRAQGKDEPSRWAYEAYYGTIKSEGWKQYQELEKIEAETLVMVGKEETVCPVEMSEQIASGVNGSTLLVFEECGHFAWLEKKDEFSKEMKRFLQI